MKKIHIENLSDLTLLQSDAEYIVKKGFYEIGEWATKEKFLYLSNNDGSLKRIAFLLDGLKNVTLDFSGSALMFKGRISPFVLENCENIVLKNFTVFYDRPFYTCGKILAHDERSAEIFIDPKKFPYRVEKGSIVAYGDYWEKPLSDGINLFIEIDNERKRPAYNTGIVLPLIGDSVVKHPTPPIPQVVWRAEATEFDTVLLKGDFSFLTGNNRFVITHENRLNCVVAAIDSKNVALEELTIHESGAMGALFQNCEDVSLRGVRVAARSDKAYLVSTNCDATHFVNCRGKVRVEDCEFENMMDDGGNIHGIYTLVKSREGNTVIAALSHFQQYGVNVYRKGDTVEISSPDMKARREYTVLSARLLSPSEIELVLSGDTDFAEEGFVIDDITAFPEVWIKNCRTGDNRPRGFLLNTNKKTVVEGCTFYNSDVGIAISGDNSYWFEATGVRDVTIRNNVFDNCGYHCSDYSMFVRAEIKNNPAVSDYHRGIKVENNLFKTFSGGCVYVANCEDLVFENNEVELTTAYPVRSRHQAVERDEKS